MIEKRVLEHLGLSEKESRIYMALLELGKGTVLEISRQAKIKRSTAYLVLDDLKSKDLVRELPEVNKIIYVAEDPELFEKNLRRKLDDLKELVPVLKAKYNSGKNPKIRFIEGKENLYKIFMKEIAEAKVNYFYGTSVKRFCEIWPSIFEDWIKEIWPRKVKQSHDILEIVANHKEDIAYAKKSIGEREVRILPKGEEVFLAANVVTDDKVYFISLDHLFCVIIESEIIAKTYKTMVKLAWQSAIPASEWV